MRTAIDEDAENDFGRSSLYAWDSQFYWDVDGGVLSSCMWRYITAVDDEYITCYGRGGTI